MSDIIFKIDGREVAAQPGETILQAAARIGVEIPTLCYNQKISKTTSCFVCVVKDCKTGKFLPSCSACPAPGQEIDASSDEVKDMRLRAHRRLRSAMHPRLPRPRHRGGIRPGRPQRRLQEGS